MKTFEIYRDVRGLWRWRLVARNGRIVANGGEGYSSKGNVNRAIDEMQHIETINANRVYLEGGEE